MMRSKLSVSSNPVFKFATMILLVLGSFLHAQDGSQQSTSQDPSGAFDQLLESTTQESEFSWYKTMYDVLVQASESQLVGFLEKSLQVHSPTRQRALQVGVCQRLAEIDPSKALKHVESFQTEHTNSLVKEIFAQWSHSDLDNAIKAVQELGESLQLAALSGISESGGVLPDELRSKLIYHLATIGANENTSSSALQSASLEELKSVWSALINDDKNDISQIEPLVRVADSLLQEEGLNVLSLVKESLDDNQSLRDSVMNTLIHVRANNNPQRAFQEAWDLGGRLGVYSLGLVSQEWATIDPIGALERIKDVNPEGLRNVLNTKVITGWSQNDPEQLVRELAILPTELQDDGLEMSARVIARDDPKNAIRLLQEISSFSSRRAVAEEIALNWSRENVLEALEWTLYSNEISDQSRQEVVGVVLRRLSREDPTLAFDTALNQPLEEFGIGLESIVVDVVAESDPDRAMIMLEKVRPGITKRFAYSSVGRGFVRQNEFDTVIDLSSFLDANEQIGYFNTVMVEWSLNHPSILYEMIDQLPSQQIKTQAAIYLLHFDARTESLSDDQVEHLRNEYPVTFGHDWKAPITVNEMKVDPLMDVEEMRENFGEIRRTEEQSLMEEMLEIEE